MAAEDRPDSERKPVSETEPEAPQDPPPTAEPAGEPDPPAGIDEDEASGPVPEGMAVPTAAELTESVKARRRMRQAGLENLKGTWFGAARFGGPASFGGHAAARDVNIFYGPAERSVYETGPIDPELLAQIRSVHVSSRSYDGAERRLRKDRLVVLRGPDGSGKRATGLVMLNEVAGNDVNALSADTVLGSPTLPDSGLARGIWPKFRPRRISRTRA